MFGGTRDAYTGQCDQTGRGGYGSADSVPVPVGGNSSRQDPFPTLNYKRLRTFLIATTTELEYDVHLTREQSAQL